MLQLLFFSAALFLAADTDENLIRQLGNDSYEKREEASKILARKMDFDLFVKVRVAAKDADAEIVRRADDLIKSYKTKLRGEFKIDMSGYSQYPPIDGLPKDFKLNGPWKGWKRLDFIEAYREKAGPFKRLDDLMPNWASFRGATEILMKERANYAFEQITTTANSETELRNGMAQALCEIRKDIEILAINEDKFGLEKLFDEQVPPKRMPAFIPMMPPIPP